MNLPRAAHVSLAMNRGTAAGAAAAVTAQAPAAGPISFGVQQGKPAIPYHNHCPPERVGKGDASQRVELQGSGLGRRCVRDVSRAGGWTALATGCLVVLQCTCKSVAFASKAQQPGSTAQAHHSKRLVHIVGRPAAHGACMCAGCTTHGRGVGVVILVWFWTAM